MLFFIIVLAALALWAVVAGLLAVAHDGPGRRSTAARPEDYPLLTDARFFTR